MKWDSAFLVVNNCAGLILGTLVILAPIFMVIFYCRKFNQWEDPDFEEKYGAVFEGLRKDSRLSLLYPLIFIFRRLILLALVTLARENIVAQLVVMDVVSII